MSIQSNINQGISLMSLLISQTPLAEEARAKAAAEVAESKAKEKIATEAAEKEARFKTLEEHAQKGISAEKTAAGQDAELDVYRDVATLAKERYLANPTDKTYEDYITYSTGYREAEESLTTKRANLAAKRAKAEKDAVEAGREEARRLAISRSITEGVYSTEPTFDPRYTGGKKK